MQTKIEISGIVRTLLASIGAFFLGKSLFGHNVDNVLLNEIIGIVMGVVSVVWSVLDKTASVEMVQGALRQTITFVGGFLIGAGYVTNQGVQSILGLATALGPFIQGYLARVKNTQLHNGTINTQQLKK